MVTEQGQEKTALVFFNKLTVIQITIACQQNNLPDILLNVPLHLQRL